MLDKKHLLIAFATAMAVIASVLMNGAANDADKTGLQHYRRNMPFRREDAPAQFRLGVQMIRMLAVALAVASFVGALMFFGVIPSPSGNGF